MKTIKKNKLALSTETLAPLTNDALDQVAGGASLQGLSHQLSEIIRRTAVCSVPRTIACTVAA